MSAVRKPTLAGKIIRAREIIDSYSIGAPFSAAHLCELADLAGCELRSAQRMLNPRIAFHASRATYQLLCRGCNSRKGAR